MTAVNEPESGSTQSPVNSIEQNQETEESKNENNEQNKPHPVLVENELNEDGLNIQQPKVGDQYETELNHTEGTDGNAEINSEINVSQFWIANYSPSMQTQCMS